MCALSRCAGSFVERAWGDGERCGRESLEGRWYGLMRPPVCKRIGKKTVGTEVGGVLSRALGKGCAYLW